jgi:hypothetical protein
MWLKLTISTRRHLWNVLHQKLRRITFTKVRDLFCVKIQHYFVCFALYYISPTNWNFRDTNLFSLFSFHIREDSGYFISLEEVIVFLSFSIKVFETLWTFHLVSYLNNLSTWYIFAILESSPPLLLYVPPGSVFDTAFCHTVCLQCVLSMRQMSTPKIILCDKQHRI